MKYHQYGFLTKFKYLLKKDEKELNMGEKEYDLVIFDDMFPHLLASFRFAEFNAYLKEFDKSIIYSRGISIHFNQQKSFKLLLKEYEQKFSQFRNRVFEFDKTIVLKAKLCYMLFAFNANNFLKFMEKNKIPFVFTLYHGELFSIIQNKFFSSLFQYLKKTLLPLLFQVVKNINRRNLHEFFISLVQMYGVYLNQTHYRRLKKVCASKYFRKVIVTQKLAYNYIISLNVCKPSDVKFIYGVVFPIEKYYDISKSKKYYPRDKNTFDICFVAYKYSEKGIGKGYKTFINVARLLCKKYKNIFFHVAGGFNGTEYDISDIKDHIYYYGILDASQFNEFYPAKDIILSSNKPFTRDVNIVDAFPTVSCLEAGSSGVVLFQSDPLNQNIYFKNNEEIVIIQNDPMQIALKIEYYYKNPDKLYQIANNGSKKIRSLFNYNSQIKPRIEVLSKYIK
ncbi:hypothetical protein LCGC14_2439080, partial [marine sediment metagenome]